MSLPMRSASLTLPRLMSRSGGAKPIITGHPGDGGKLDGAAASPPPLDGAATMRAPNRRQSSVLNLKNIPEPPIVLDENYIFSTPDSAENIVFATTEAAAADGIPVIRCAGAQGGMVGAKRGPGADAWSRPGLALLGVSQRRHAGQAGGAADVRQVRRHQLPPAVPPDLPHLHHTRRVAGPAHGALRHAQPH